MTLFGIWFNHPWFLLLALLLVPIWILWARRRAAVGHPHIHLYGKLGRTPLIANLSKCVFALMFVAIVMAASDPEVPQMRTTESRSTRDFVIGADISGSMWSAINDQTQKAVVEADEASDRAAYPDDVDPNNQGTQGSPVPPALNRIRMARYCIKQFVRSRQGDRVALMAFDDQVYYAWPLSFDLDVILAKARLIGRRQGGGTNFDGPSESESRPGFFQTAIDHFHDVGQARTKVIIFVSDGDATISPKRHQELVEQMQQPGQTIRIYAFIIGEKSQVDSDSTKTVRELVHAVGGEVIAAGDLNAMNAGFAHINQLEKSAVSYEKTWVAHDPMHDRQFHWWLFAAVSLVILYLGICAITRENP